MFGDDSFMGIEDLFNQLSASNENSFRDTRSQPQNILNTVESNGETIITFNLSGKKVKSVGMEDDLETNDYGQKVQNGQKILEIRFENNEVLKYNLPSAIAKRTVSHTFTNGILEVSLKK